MAYGIVPVSIPREHRVGELESPSVWRLEFRRNPDRHIVLLDVEEMEPGDFSNMFADDAYRSTRHEALVFIHGYNVTFEDAARRTAQIAYDIQFDGPAAFFSWPSQGTLAGYPVDETNIKWSVPHIKEFLLTIASLADVDQVNVIAHSMGNRGATDALIALKAEAADSIQTKFKEIVLTAPDIDADIFKRDIAPRLIGDSTRITLYASSNDKALVASKQFHGNPRAGDSEALVILPGIQTIDASDVKTDFLGHSYFGESESVISDLHDLINNRFQPDQRFWLRVVPSDPSPHWRFRREAGR